MIEINNKLIFLTILFALLLGISAVSATENSTSDIVSIDTDDNLIIEENNEEQPTKPTELTFTDLNNAINGNSEDEINLRVNYKYNPDTDSQFKHGIKINRNVIIDGHGITIDGFHQTRIFDAKKLVIFKNINFINGNATPDRYDGGDGGAILGYGINVAAQNCTFIGNCAENGGAVTFVKTVGCTFINNTARVYGGAIFESFKPAETCTFINNRAGAEGGAIFDAPAICCVFTQNYANKGGAVRTGEFINCSFIQNSADVGIVYYGKIYNCKFILNKVGLGKEIYNGYYETLNDYNKTYAANCSFYNNAVIITPNKVDIDKYTSDRKFNYTLMLFNNQIDFLETKDVVMKIVIKQNGKLIDTFYSLSKPLTVDLDEGKYEVTLSIDDVPEIRPSTVELNIVDNHKSSISALNRLINNNNNSVITLERDYAFDPEVDIHYTNGIILNHKVTINGNGHTIDAKQQTRIFLTTSDNVTIENITFKNAKNSEYGGAIIWRNCANGRLSHCNFVNCSAKSAGAVFWTGVNGNVSECVFIDCSAYNFGGAIVCGDGNAMINHCTFENCHAGKDGGAIYAAVRNTVFVNGCIYKTRTDTTCNIQKL